MAFYLDLYKRTAALEKKEFDEILSLGEKTKQHAIVLTKEKVQYIIDSKNSALSDTGRVEFGESTAKRLTEKFCDSPYVSKYNFEKVIGELLEVFYYTKNETEDKISDDDLINYLYNAFNGVCAGSVTLVYDWAVNRLIESVRNGKHIPADKAVKNTGEDSDE